MPICPNCRKEEPPGTSHCARCGAPLRPSPRAGRYFVSALALAAVMALGVVAHFFIRSRTGCQPTEFLPSSAQVVVALDLRPRSAGLRQVRRTWEEDDIEALANRSLELAQELVYLTGLQLDLQNEASDWFGGQLVAAAIGGDRTRPLHAGSLVLIARVTNARRAHASIEEAVAPMAREAQWTRSEVVYQRDTITVWESDPGSTAVAYAVRDGCLLIAVNRATLEKCLTARGDPSRQLLGSVAFEHAFGPLPRTAPLWCYADLPYLRQSAQELWSSLDQGWPAVLDAFTTGPRHFLPGDRATEVPSRRAGGTVVFAFSPEADGLRLQSVYRRGSFRDGEPTPGRLPDLARLLPAETTAYLLARDADLWLEAVAPPIAHKQPDAEIESPHQGDIAPQKSDLAPSRPKYLPDPETVPSELLIALLPRADGRPLPVAVIAAPQEELPATPEWLPPALFPDPAYGTIGEFAVVAGDGEALLQCRRAAQDESRRLTTSSGPDLQCEFWARPSEMVPALARFEEVHLAFSTTAAGAEGEILLRADPGALLGAR